MNWEDDVSYRIFQARRNLHFIILEAGSGEIDSWWDSRAVIHPHWKLYLNERSGAEVTTAAGQTISLAPQSAWLIPPWTAYARRTTRVPHAWVEFDVIGLSSSSVIDVVPAPVAVPMDARIACGRDRLRTAMADSSRDDLEIQCDAAAMVTSAFASLLSGLPLGARERLLITIGDARLAPAIRRIESCLGEPLYNQALARLCGMSSARFCQLFKEATGLSPTQFVIDRRIAYAARLLATSDHSIDAIASECGFTDRFTLTRAFSRRMGSSPAVFRQGIGGRRSDTADVPFKPLVTSGRVRQRSTRRVRSDG